MANTKSAKTGASTTGAATRTKAGTVAQQVDDKTAQKNDVSPIVVKDIDPHQYVTVRNGFQGRLVYKSKHTGELFVWDRFKDEQDMELRELKDAKSSNKKMFIKNYFMFDDDWVINYLGVDSYYRNSLSIDNFDDLFKKTPSEIKKIISLIPEGQKRSVSYRARQLILDGEIDSRKSIAALEDALGVELIER